VEDDFYIPHRAGYYTSVRKISFDHLDVVANRNEVLRLPAREVVEDTNRLAAYNQPLNQVRANEPRTTRDEKHLASLPFRTAPAVVAINRVKLQA
jgi:hypothetical protein